MLSVSWFRHWDKVFWLLFAVMFLSVAVGTSLSLIAFDFGLILGTLVVIIGAGKLATEISSYKIMGYQDDLYKKLHQLSLHVEKTFNLADSHKTQSDMRLYRIGQEKRELKNDFEKRYRDMARKVIEIENRINELSGVMVETQRKALESGDSFGENVISLIKRVPRGRVTTYSELANAAGNPNASKAIGKVIASNEHLKSVPFHRIVKSDGSIGGSRKSIKDRRELLKKEGVKVRKSRVDLGNYMFRFVREI